MTSVGKIFTVLILVMSLCFMMIAVTVFATHRNWRDAALANKKVIADLKTTITRLEAEKQRSLDRLAIEQAARRFALANLQTRAEMIAEELRQREQELQNKTAEFGTLQATLLSNNNNLQALIKEVGDLRLDHRNTQQARDEKFSAVVALTDQTHALQSQLGTLEEKEVQLRDQLSRQKLVMYHFELNEHTPVVDKPPRVDGIVTAVGDKDLVEISIGRDDGLRVSHQLEVFRDANYLGRVTVQSIEPDRAVCRVIPEYRKGLMKKGDRVATQLD